MDDASAKELFVLGRLAMRPSHGHEIMRTLYRSRADLWVDLSKKHVYYILRKLEREELLSVTEERTGNLPARKVFAITATGRARLATMLTADSLVRSIPHSDFDVVFGMLCYTDVLSAAEKDAVLERRATFLRELADDARRVAAEAADRPEMGGVQHAVLDKVARVAEAELAWLEETAATIAQDGWEAMRPLVDADAATTDTDPATTLANEGDPS
jgi:DNA-binding PadR family transcriptional regulator